MAEENKKIPKPEKTKPEVKKHIRESIELGEKVISPPKDPKDKTPPHLRSEKKEGNSSGPNK